MNVIQISREETLPLRQEVLRKGYPVQNSLFPGDLMPESIHLGIMHVGKIICTGSFYPNKHPDFKQKIQYQLRGMATDAAYRNRGAGRILALEGIEIIKERKADLIWCNARQVAFSFYERLQFKYYGEYFNSVENIPHKVMYLEI